MNGRTSAFMLLAVSASAVPVEAQRKSQQEWWAEVIDYNSRELGLKPLRTAPPVELRVLRVWVGFGMSVPEYVVTITVKGTKVEGSLLLHWGKPSEDLKEDAAEGDSNRAHHREFIKESRAQYGCGPIRTSKSLYYCEATLVPDQSWTKLLGVLDSLGIETLPDEDDLVPPGPVGFDGTTLLVEVHRGSAYRMYRYWSPDANSTHEEVRRASAIIDLVYRIGWRQN